MIMMMILITIIIIIALGDKLLLNFRPKFSALILPPEKFLQLQSDWLRAEVFQLNLKYLHLKITFTMVNKIKQ